MSDVDPLDLASLPVVQKSGGSERTIRRRQRQNQAAKSDSDVSTRTSPVRHRKQKSIVGVSSDDTPKGTKNRIKYKGGSRKRSKSSRSSHSMSDFEGDKQPARLVYQTGKIGGMVGSSMGRSGLEGSHAGHSARYNVPPNKPDLPYDPAQMASQCKRVSGFPNLVAQRAEIGRFKELFRGTDPVFSRSSDVFCSSKVRGMGRKRYSRMEDNWNKETSCILNQTARVATIVQSRSVGMVFDVIFEYRAQVPELYEMYRAASGPEGWE